MEEKKSFWKELQFVWSGLSDEFKKSFYFILATFFIVLATYPMLRTTTESLYITTYGGKATPVVWFYSVVVLSITIFIYNKLYQLFHVRYLYLFTTLISLLVFSFGPLLAPQMKWLVYILYIWKEVYIVLLIHLILGHFNENIDVSFAKLFYGLVGAIGSIGGILGGVFVHYLTFHITTEQIILWSNIPMLLGAALFWNALFLTEKEPDQSTEKKTKKAPLKELQGVGFYVLLLVSLLALTQIVINFANFKLNILFDQFVPNKEEKTRFLSALYSFVNVFSLTVQIFLIPFLFKIFSIRKIHLFIPIFYTISIFTGFFLIGNLMAVATVFVSLKGSDYSLFNAAKELLYFPLKKEQKTGAKYIVDMVAYRGAKGLISFVLIFFQSELFITIGLFASLLTWILLLIPLLTERGRLLNEGYKDE